MGGIRVIMDYQDMSVIPALAGGGASPLVSRQKFAEMVGLPVGVIIGWCNKGLLPCTSIGRYSLINVAAIQRSCAEKEFSA